MNVHVMCGVLDIFFVNVCPFVPTNVDLRSMKCGVLVSAENFGFVGY